MKKHLPPPELASPKGPAGEEGLAPSEFGLVRWSPQALSRLLNCLPPAILVTLFTVDVTLRVLAALHNTNFLYGDALAPFSLVDQFYHHEPVDRSRQMWLLPWASASVFRIFGGTLSYQQLFSLYNAVTALAASLAIPAVYLMCRRFMTPYGALLSALLLSTNCSYFLASVYNNPTQVYALCMTIATLCLVYLDRWPTPMAYITACLAGVGFMVRWEGLLLLALVISYLVLQARQGLLPRRSVTIIVALATALVVAVLASHVFGSSAPFAFLSNTNATAPTWSLCKMDLSQATKLVVRSLTWKFEKLNALSANLTLFGVILATIGGLAAFEKRSVILFPVIYWVAYEMVMFLFTLAVPIGADRQLLFLENFDLGPVPRYYQVFTPVFIVLVCIGARRVFDMIPQIRPQVRNAIVSVLIVLFLVQQIYTAQHTYFTQFFSVGRVPPVSEIIATAEYFRSHDIRNQDIAVVRYEGSTLKYCDYFQTPVQSYSFHSFHFSVMSGRNRTNGTGYNLVNPNLFCSVLTGSDIADLDKNPLGGAFGYAVLLKPDFGLRPPGFRVVCENSIALILERPHKR